MNTKIKIGVLGTANIAYNRMIPAILKSNQVEYVGTAIANKQEWEMHTTDIYNPVSKQEKATLFQNAFGGKIWDSYESLLQSPEIDAVYIPLPPSLHYFWMKKSLEYGKHILCEKPFTTNTIDTKEILTIAQRKKLTVIENYGFVLHPQTKCFMETFNQGNIGKFRLFRAQFTFPHRGLQDFRYNPHLGGGALLDCGGYVVKAATLFLGDTTRVVCSSLNTDSLHEVDLYGNATLSNSNGEIAQICFGMDNVYRCEMELLGSLGSIKTTRAFTAPNNLEIELELQISNNKSTAKIESADQFLLLLNHFADSINNLMLSEKLSHEILQQSILVDKVKEMGI